jgi:hypothetical protein
VHIPVYSVNASIFEVNLPKMFFNFFLLLASIWTAEYKL